MRIKDIKGYKGEDKAFVSLNTAIWAKALDDEFRRQKHRLFFNTSEKIFNVLSKYDKQDLNTYVKITRIIGERYGECGLRLVQKLESIIEENSATLKKAVQNKIYKESMSWPNNSRDDPEYEKKYVVIMDDILNSFSEVSE